MAEYDYIFKVCLFADKDVGKKTLTGFLEKVGLDETGLTLGVEWFVKDVLFNGNKTIRVDLWTNINKEYFQPLWQSYIQGSKGIILMYDITSVKSLKKLSEWYQKAKNQLDYDVPILLVGNKLDLEENREVSKEQLEKFKEENYISESMEISLKSGGNVEKMFLRITEMML